MLFNSFEFWVFFAAVCSLFFNAPKNTRWPILLVASYIFYMSWRPIFGLLIFTTTIFDYVAARGIDASKSSHARRAWMLLSISVNLTILFTFKYLDFLVGSVWGFAGLLGALGDPPLLHLTLPVGISFFTFQSLSYTLDVYRRKIPAQKHFGLYALYVSFFPQLVAGPIERGAHLLPQIEHIAAIKFDSTRVRSGLMLAIWGLFKKLCVADLVAPVVNGIYADPAAFNGSYLMIATVLFALQIYCDFSGYSDIAIGVARVMGFDLMTNFRQPYFSTSLTEFWRRWHISLSTWFRDYLYFPLGGNRVSFPLWTRNILIVFVVSGIWHGAAWTFVVWGAIHGTMLIIEETVRRATVRFRPRAATNLSSAAVASTKTGGLQAFLGWVVTTCIVVVAWVFFRAKTIGDAGHILAGFLSPGPISYGTFKVLHLASFELILAVVQIATLLTVDWALLKQHELAKRLWDQHWFRMAAAVFLFYDVTLFGVFDRVDFIYFQF